MNPPIRISKTRRGFSLVEVALAMGIASFCLLAVAGLVPVGLDAVRGSREEAGAARCLEHISRALRTATPDASAQYQASDSYPALTWTAGTGLKVTLDDLSLDGRPTVDPLEQRLVSRVEIPPAGDQALVSVAWPARATWNEVSASWENAQGSLSTCVVFRSRK